MAGYLKVENRVKVAPSVELMRMLGASGSRGNPSRIGQFGSGFPNSLALLARNGLLEGFKVCLGLDVYTFETFTHDVIDAGGYACKQEEIRMRKQNGGTWDLNISTEFGSLDWDNVTMAIREFISNACDGAESFDGTYGSVEIDPNVPGEGRNTRAKDGYIRIYVPMTDEIYAYATNLNRYFPCLVKGYSPSRRIVLNNTDESVRVYRKGVLVSEPGFKSLFHYNITDIDIDESRNVDVSVAKEACATEIARCSNVDIIGKVLQAKIDDDDTYEAGFNSWTLNPAAQYFDNSTEREKCLAAWKLAAEDILDGAIVCKSDIAARMVESKGFAARPVESWLYNRMRALGCKSSEDVLNASELEGKQIIPATPSVQALTDLVWNTLERFNLTLGKDKPGCECFVQHLTEGMHGYYRPGGSTIYIRSDISDNTGVYTLQVVIEEIAHYVTGASDCTREFQTFAFNLAALLMQR